MTRIDTLRVPRFGFLLAIAVVALVWWRCGKSPTAPSLSCSYDDAVSASHCGCDVAAPLDLGASAGVVELWPFGVHAQSGHVEGHRGLDLITTTHTIPVLSPVNGTVLSIDNSQDSSGSMVLEYGSTPRFTTITADCGLQVKFIPLLLDAGIVAGTRVTKGSRLGVLPELLPPYGPNRWSTHFEIDAKPSPSDPALVAVCPAHLLSSSEVATLTDLLNASNYPEKVARTVNVSCDNGTTLSMTYPAENQLCNPRLDATSHSRLAGCVPSKASFIW